MMLETDSCAAAMSALESETASLVEILKRELMASLDEIHGLRAQGVEAKTRVQVLEAEAMLASCERGRILETNLELEAELRRLQHQLGQLMSANQELSNAVQHAEDSALKSKRHEQLLNSRDSDELDRRQNKIVSLESHVRELQCERASMEEKHTTELLVMQLQVCFRYQPAGS